MDTRKFKGNSGNNATELAKARRGEVAIMNNGERRNSNNN